MNVKPHPLITMIVPAYNEETLLAGTLEVLIQFLKPRYSCYEIIIVDDGSEDQTPDVVASIGKSQPVGAPIRLLRNDRNMGKGYSIRRGVLESRGRYVVFTDADLPYDPEAIERMVAALESGHSLAIGSRVLRGSEIRRVPLLRYVAGQTFSLLVRLLAVPGIHDTQCGLKAFTAEAALQVFSRLTIRGFGFDVETLYIARKLGYSILPVTVRMIGHRYDSRVRVLHDSVRMLADLIRIRINDLSGRYDRS